MRPVGMRPLMAAGRAGRQACRHFTALPPWEWKGEKTIVRNSTVVLSSIEVLLADPIYL